MMFVKIGHVLCTWICIMHLPKRVESTNVEMRPYGHKMCQQFCDIAGCLYQFSFPFLSCNVRFVNISSKARKYMVIYRSQADMPKVKHFCDFGSLRGNLGQNEKRKNRMQASLLIAHHNKRTSEMFSLYDLDTYRVNRLSKPLGKGFTAVAATSKYQLVFIATRHPNHLCAYCMKTHKRSLLKDGLKINDMAVDEEAELLFFATSQPGGVHRMSFTGTDSEVVDLYGCNINSVALDTKRKIIYAAGGPNCRKNVFSVGYDGYNYTTLIYKYGTVVVAVDKESKYIYFNRQLKFYRMSVVNRHMEFLVKVEHRPNDIVLYENQVYFALGESPNIYIFTLGNNQTEILDFVTRPLSSICVFHTFGVE